MANGLSLPYFFFTLFEHSFLHYLVVLKTIRYIFTCFYGIHTQWGEIYVILLGLVLKTKK